MVLQRPGHSDRNSGANSKKNQALVLGIDAAPPPAQLPDNPAAHHYRSGADTLSRPLSRVSAFAKKPLSRAWVALSMNYCWLA